jgi:hypothetical protein
MKEELLNLWKEYKSSRWARENLNIPDGLPVFNATSFFGWLEDSSYKSSCCGVGVYCRGIGTKAHYVCNKCDKPCKFE